MFHLPIFMVLGATVVIICFWPHVTLVHVCHVGGGVDGHGMEGVS